MSRSLSCLLGKLFCLRAAEMSPELSETLTAANSPKLLPLTARLSLCPVTVSPKIPSLSNSHCYVPSLSPLMSNRRVGSPDWLQSFSWRPYTTACRHRSELSLYELMSSFLDFCTFFSCQCRFPAWRVSGWLRNLYLTILSVCGYFFPLL